MKRVTTILLIFMALLIVALVAVIVVTSRDDKRAERERTEQGSNRETKRAIEQFQAEQIERVLNLKGEQLEEFREIYKAYVKASKPSPNLRSPFGGGANLTKISNEEIEESITESFNRTKREIEVKEEYYLRFREILSPREIAMMYEVERRTRERLLEEFQRRNERAQGGGGPENQGERGERAERPERVERPERHN